MSLDFLLALTKSAWRAADPPAQHIFAPAIARAYVYKARGELASELLKLIGYVQGSDSIDKELERDDKLAAFSRGYDRGALPDDHFATVWNRPGTEHLKPADRARRLLKDLGSSSVENALRRVRRMVKRGWQMTGYHKGPDGRARQIR